MLWARNKSANGNKPFKLAIKYNKHIFCTRQTTNDLKHISDVSNVNIIQRLNINHILLLHFFLFQISKLNIFIRNARFLWNLSLSLFQKSPCEVYACHHCLWNELVGNLLRSFQSWGNQRNVYTIHPVEVEWRQKETPYNKTNTEAVDVH